MNRAYINLESGEVRAEFRVFPAFLPFSWNPGGMHLHAACIDCGYAIDDIYE
jgi:hypothetical protein